MSLGNVNSVGAVQLDLETNSKPFQSQMNSLASNVTSIVGGAFKKLSSVLISAFAIKGIAEFGKASIEVASDLAEVQNVVDVTFGEMSSSINSWSKAALKQFGLSELSAKRFSSTMGAMLKSSGLTGKSVYTMSTSIAELTGDMASFYNLDHEAAFNKIRSGISGETEPLKQLGINMSVANLEAYALSQGIKTSYKEMSQAEQVMLRYNYLLNATKDAQGDFSRTSGSWANQTKILTENWKTFMATMGEGFINVLTPVLQFLNNVIEKLQVAALYFKAFTELITGKAEESTETTDTLTASIEDVGEGVEKTSKKVKKSLAVFDQLNTLAMGATDALNYASQELGAGFYEMLNMNGSGEDLSREIDISVNGAERLEKVSESLNKIKGLLTVVGNFFAELFPQSEMDKHKNNFDELVENHVKPAAMNAMISLRNIAGGLKDSFTNMIEEFLPTVRKLGETFETKFLPLMVDVLADVIDITDDIFDVAKTAFDDIIDDVLSPAFATIAKMVDDELEDNKKLWKKYGGDIKTEFQNALDNVKDSWDLWWSTTGKPIFDIAFETWEKLWEEHLSPLSREIKEFTLILTEEALKIYNQFIAPVVDLFTIAFAPAIALAFKSVSEIIKNAVGNWLDMFKGVFGVLSGLTKVASGIARYSASKLLGVENTEALEDAKEGLEKYKESALIAQKAMKDMVFAVPKEIENQLDIFKEWPKEYADKYGKSYSEAIQRVLLRIKYGNSITPEIRAVSSAAQVDPLVLAALTERETASGSTAVDQAILTALNALLAEMKQNNNKDWVLELDSGELVGAIRKSIDNHTRMIGSDALK